MNETLKTNFNLLNIPDVITTARKPSLYDGWLSGFTDAEGCFSVTISYSPIHSVRCRFILDQKDGKELFDFISILFNSGKATLRKNTNNVYRLTIHMTKLIRSGSTLVIDYFDRFPLKTSKIENFKVWCKIVEIIKFKQYFTKDDLDEIKKLLNK